jgi:hypothetical protein
MLFMHTDIVKPVDFRTKEFYEFLYDSLPTDHYDYVVDLFEKGNKTRTEYEKDRDLIEGIGHG